jgi:hypothetical protein
VLAALIAQIPDLPGLGDKGPNSLEALLDWCFVLLALGFAIGVLGHMTRSRALVAIGISVVMVGSAVFVLAIGRYG